MRNIGIHPISTIPKDKEDDVIKKSILLLFIIIITFSGCTSKTGPNKNATNTPSPTTKAPTSTPIPTIDPKALSKSQEDSASFQVGATVVKVEEATSSITSIDSLSWLDDIRVVVICNINPTLRYLTVYNTQDKAYEFSLYGTNFIWDNNNLRTLVYAEAPPQVSDDPDAVYRINDYFGETLYESHDRIENLRYMDGKVHFNLVDQDNKKTEKTLPHN